MFTVRTEHPLIPADASARLLRVELTVPRPAEDASRRPVHLSLVIDRSGSMGGEKLAMALLAARQSIRTLAEGDRFSVITFDEQIEVPVPSSEATPEARIRAESSLDGVTARGQTDLAGGWLRGCDEVGAHLPADAVGRCLLITDGQANHGITAPDVLARHAQEQRLRRVTTSTLGLGDGFNEFLLGRLSEEGGGNFYFAARADELPGYVARELGDVLSVVARDATIVIQAPAGIDIESLNDYPHTRAGDTFTFSLGSLTGGMVLAPVFRLRFAAGAVGERLAVAVRLTDSDAALSQSPREVVWTRTDSQPLAPTDPLVTRHAAALDAARARRRALELNRSGQEDDATARLAEAAALLRSYAAGDREILARAAALDADREPYGRPMSSVGSKGRYLQAMRAMKLGLEPEPDADIRVLPTTARLAAVTGAAIAALQAVQGAPSITEDVSLLRTVLAPDVLSEDAERELVARAVGLGAAVKVVFVEPPLQNRWFSHWHPRERTAIVSLADVDRLIPYPVATFAAYSLTLYGLCGLSATYEPLRMLHDDTRACLFDLCRQKTDVKIKLAAGHVCPSCMQKLVSFRLDADLVTRLWRAVQDLSRSPR